MGLLSIIKQSSLFNSFSKKTKFMSLTINGCIKKWGLVALALSFFTLSATAQIDFKKEGKQVFQFDNNGQLKKPIRVFYFIPSSRPDTLPVFILMHGAKRSPSSYLDGFIAAATVFGFVVVAPEFTTEDYPGSEYYNSGNVVNKQTKKFNDPKDWTFSLIEPLFDFVKKETLSTSAGYYLYGHSAGAQFVHRFLTFLPQNRVLEAAVANAGWYTMPAFEAAFPFGLKGSFVTDDMLKKTFAKKVHIMVGEADTDTSSEDFNKTPSAMLQGKNRFERGISYYAAAKKKATELKTLFNWTEIHVPNIGHDNKGMSKFAAALFSMKMMAK